MTFFRPKPCFWVTLTHFGALSRKHLCCALENEKEEIGWILFYFFFFLRRKEKRFSTHICCCCCQRPLCQNYCLTFMVFCRILSHFASYLYLAVKAFAAYFFGIFRLFRRLTQMWHRIFGSSSFWGGTTHTHTQYHPAIPNFLPNPHNMALVFGQVVCSGCMACCVIAAICLGKGLIGNIGKNIKLEVWHYVRSWGLGKSGDTHVVGTAFKLLLIGKAKRNETKQTEQS